MNDRPNSKEMLTAIIAWLTDKAAPALKENPALRFQALIAANLLRILGTEAVLEPQLIAEEAAWLSQRVTMDDHGDDVQMAITKAKEDLCIQIREGAFDEPEAFRELLREVKESVKRKLQVNRPQG